MFKSANVEDEIYRSMEASLVKNQTENLHGFNKLAKAVDLLNTAAAIFEQAGMITEAQEITNILHKLAQDVQWLIRMFLRMH